MVLQTEKRNYTLEEYLELEEKAEYKNEYRDGEIKNYDKIDKFKYYRSIPDFPEYIMIDQYSFAVEQFTKQAEGQWMFREYEGEEAVLILNSIDFQIALREIYERVNFELVEE